MLIVPFQSIERRREGERERGIKFLFQKKKAITITHKQMDFMSVVTCVKVCINSFTCVHWSFMSWQEMIVQVTITFYSQFNCHFILLLVLLVVVSGDAVATTVDISHTNIL